MTTRDQEQLITVIAILKHSHFMFSFVNVCSCYHNRKIHYTLAIKAWSVTWCQSMTIATNTPWYVRVYTLLQLLMLFGWLLLCIIWCQVEKYMQNTHAKTHSGYTVDIAHLFRISREGELDRFGKVKLHVSITSQLYS